MQKVAYFLPSILWAALIMILSLTSGKQLPKVNIVSFDKIAHLGVYAILAFLLFWAFLKLQIRSVQLFIAVALLLIGYGVALEYAQYFLTPDRYFEWADAFANGLGVIVGIMFVNILFKFKTK